MGWFVRLGLGQGNDLDCIFGKALENGISFLRGAVHGWLERKIVREQATVRNEGF